MGAHQHQFCPIAKASEILCERWTLLVVRELLLGSCHFSDFHRGLPMMSPGLLTRRLRTLEEAGVLARVKTERGVEYRPTLAGEELRPMVQFAGHWGARWVRSRLLRDELDAGSLMWFIHRHFKPEHLPQRDVVIHLRLTDEKRLNRWWIIVTLNGVELCLDDPGRDVDVYVTTDLRTLTEIYLGDASFEAAMLQHRVTVVGSADLTRTIPRWFARSRFADTRPASAQERRAMAPAAGH